MRVNKQIFLIGVFMIFGMNTLFAQNTFTTEKLKLLSKSLPDINFTHLAEGTHTNYYWGGHEMIIRVNRWNEIEHIGFHFFDTLITQDNRLIFDFVERYFFDLTVSDDPDKNLRMAIDHFHIDIGSFETIFSTQQTDIVDISWIDMKRYQMVWRRDGKPILSLMFDMNYQMLTGCNAIELEQKYLRTICRDAYHAPKVNHFKPIELDTCQSISYVEQGGTFMLEAINNNRYYTQRTKGWKLVCSPRSPAESAYNILLSPDSLGHFIFNIDLDVYGYKTQSFSVSVSSWIARCIEEGCTPYMGIKEVKNNLVKATIFCPNKQAGYCHIVSVELPYQVIIERGGVIHGRMYAFIPMNDISPKFFK